MVDSATIFDAVDRIAAEFRPAQIILFGSAAYGNPTPDSDVDLLVVMNYRGASHRVAARIRHSLQSVAFPLDIIVRRGTEIHDRVAGNDFFLAEIMRKGLVLYAADDARMGEQGRRRLRCCTRKVTMGYAD